MKKEIFKKAHNLTKGLIRKGDSYKATFKLALSFVYSQIKKEAQTLTIEDKLVNAGLKVWEKYGHKRIYTTITELAEKVGYDLLNPVGFRKNKIYFDCNTGDFSCDCSNGRKTTVRELVNFIKNI